MAKTKTTTRKEYRRCPMCSEPAWTEDEFKRHIMICAMRHFECPICDFTNSRELNLKRHVKRCHPGLGPNDEPIKLGPKEQNKDPEKAGCSFGDENKDEGANEDWLDQDPGEVIGEISSANSSSSNSSDEEDDIDEQKEKEDREKIEGNLLEGRVFRKKTQPTLPFTRKRPSLEGIPVPKKTTCMDFSIQVDIPGVTPVQSNRVDAYTQTSPKKREVMTKTTKKYREGEADIKVVTKERLIYK
ncbi:RE1-silencing transcription factor-like [Saccostrea cucullata]|uniref:RE1-silencing transcription factor-like n=1 Tax=Saccostrea cuccullata TaxID=36930 RepID=UPI002ED6B8E7